MDRYDYLLKKKTHPSLAISKMIEGIHIKADTIEMMEWLGNVPLRYQEMCIKSASRIFDRFEGSKLTQSTLENFINELHKEIIEDLIKK